MKSLRSISALVSGLFASALAIGMVAVAQPAFAQDTVIATKVKIPFAFEAGSRVMPAGTYTITESDHILTLRENTQKASDFVLVHPAYTNHTPTKSVIAFDRRGDSYFLRNVWVANDNTGIECPKSRTEKQLEKQLVAANSTLPSDTVTLALNTSPQR